MFRVTNNFFLTFDEMKILLEDFFTLGHQSNLLGSVLIIVKKLGVGNSPYFFQWQ
jgi:hypothetical protein